jgi:hypothetical protein
VLLEPAAAAAAAAIPLLLLLQGWVLAAVIFLLRLRQVRMMQHLMRVYRVLRVRRKVVKQLVLMQMLALSRCCCSMG